MDGVHKFLGIPFVGADAPSSSLLIVAMTVRQSAALRHLPSTCALLVALALIPGFASADDCVLAAAPKAAVPPAKPRPLVRAVVKRPPPAVDLNALAEPKSQPVGQAKPQPPARPRVVVHRKRPSATANLAASQQSAPKPAANAVPSCTPVADPQAAVRAPLLDAPRFTPIDPPTRLLSESSVRQDPLEGIRTGLPGEGLGPSFPIALLPTPPGGGSQIPTVEKPAPVYPPISPIPPVEPIPPIVTIPPVDPIPPVTDKPVDPEAPHPVPVPGSVWLVLAGLGALLRQRRRAWR
jgi:hypothetical protein